MKERAGINDGLVAKHPDRAAIEMALAKRTPFRKLSAKYGISVSSLQRHRQRLLRDAPELFERILVADWQTSPEELEHLKNETSAGWLKAVRSDLVKVMLVRDQALADGDLPTASMFTGHVKKYFDLIGRAVDQLQQGGSTFNIQNNFYSSPDFWSYQTAILQALVSHPAARACVLEAIEKLERNDAAPPMITVSGREVAA